MQIEPKPSDYWYSPPYVLDAVNAFMPGYFDPCPVDPQFDGLTTRWEGDCFINPPYSQRLRAAFIDEAYRGYYRSKRYLWLMNYANNRDVALLHNMASAVCIPEKRIKFIPGHPALGDGKSPRYDNIFILWGDPAGFAEAFNSIGRVYICK